MRAYYHYQPCQAGFCPRDTALNIEGTSLSPAVTRMVGLVGAMVSFEEGHELLHELAGVDVPTKHLERAAEALGCENRRGRETRCRPAGHPNAGTEDVPGHGRHRASHARRGVRRGVSTTSRTASDALLLVRKGPRRVSPFRAWRKADRTVIWSVAGQAPTFQRRWVV